MVVQVPDSQLRVTQAARLLGVTTKQPLALIHDRRIEYVMVNGIAHVPVDAIADYRAGGAR